MNFSRYSEACSHGYNFERRDKQPGTGHFTQLIWKDTRELGVGLSAVQHPEGSACSYIVARYYKAGNDLRSILQNVEKGRFNEASCSNGYRKNSDPYTMRNKGDQRKTESYMIESEPQNEFDEPAAEIDKFKKPEALNKNTIETFDSPSEISENSNYRNQDDSYFVSSKTKQEGPMSEDYVKPEPSSNGMDEVGILSDDVHTQKDSPETVKFTASIKTPSFGNHYSNRFPYEKGTEETSTSMVNNFHYNKNQLNNEELLLEKMKEAHMESTSSDESDKDVSPPNKVMELLPLTPSDQGTNFHNQISEDKYLPNILSSNNVKNTTSTLSSSPFNENIISNNQQDPSTQHPGLLTPLMQQSAVPSTSVSSLTNQAKFESQNAKSNSALYSASSNENQQVAVNPLAEENHSNLNKTNDNRIEPDNSNKAVNNKVDSSKDDTLNVNELLKDASSSIKQATSQLAEHSSSADASKVSKKPSPGSFNEGYTEAVKFAATSDVYPDIPDYATDFLGNARDYATNGLSLDEIGTKRRHTKLKVPEYPSKYFSNRPNNRIDFGQQFFNTDKNHKGIDSAVITSSDDLSTHHEIGSYKSNSAKTHYNKGLKSTYIDHRNANRQAGSQKLSGYNNAFWSKMAATGNGLYFNRNKLMDSGRQKSDLVLPNSATPSRNMGKNDMSINNQQSVEKPQQRNQENNYSWARRPYPGKQGTFSESYSNSPYVQSQQHPNNLNRNALSRPRPYAIMQDTPFDGVTVAKNQLASSLRQGFKDAILGMSDAEWGRAIDVTATKKDIFSRVSPNHSADKEKSYFTTTNPDQNRNHNIYKNKIYPGSGANSSPKNTYDSQQRGNWIERNYDSSKQGPKPSNNTYKFFALDNSNRLRLLASEESDGLRLSNLVKKIQSQRLNNLSNGKAYQRGLLVRNSQPQFKHDKHDSDDHKRSRHFVIDRHNNLILIPGETNDYISDFEQTKLDLLAGDETNYGLQAWSRMIQSDGVPSSYEDWVNREVTGVHKDHPEPMPGQRNDKEQSNHRQITPKANKSTSKKKQQSMYDNMALLSNANEEQKPAAGQQNQGNGRVKVNILKQQKQKQPEPLNNKEGVVPEDSGLGQKILEMETIRKPHIEGKAFISGRFLMLDSPTEFLVHQIKSNHRQIFYISITQKNA